MPPTESGIEGAVHHVPVQGKLQGITYFLRNGVASLAISRPRSDANSKLVVEYENYEKCQWEYLDYGYCPEHGPLKQRVCPHPPHIRHHFESCSIHILHSRVSQITMLINKI
jgi:hypothetical protein